MAKLVATTIRFDPASYDYVRDEARDAGITVAQFVREAALIRAVLRSAGRNGTSLHYVRLGQEVERLARVQNERRAR